MTINFSGGIHEVKIFKDGKEWSRQNFPILFNSIAQVEAQIRNGNLGQMRIDITPSFTDAIQILESGLLGIGMTEKGQQPKAASADSGTRSITAKSTDQTISSPKVSSASNDSNLSESIYPLVAVRFLYAGQTDTDGTEATTPWFAGMMMQPEVSISSTDISITIRAASMGVMASKFISTARFENETVYDCVQKLIQPYGMEITFDDDDDETEDILTKKDNAYTGISSEPALLTIKNILLTVDCYFTLISSDGKETANELRIKSRRALSASEPDYTFVLWRQIDPGRNVIPIYDFKVETNGALFLPGGAFGGSHMGIDSSTKETVDLKVDDKSESSKALTGTKTAGKGALPKSTGQQGGLQNGIDSIPADQKISGDQIPIYDNGKNNNTASIESKALIDGSLGLQYHITVPGLPGIRAMRMAQVIIGDNIRGISGPGQIYGFTHRTGGDGWTTEVEFRRQPGLVGGVVVDPKETAALQRPTAQGNSKTPESIA